MNRSAKILVLSWVEKAAGGEANETGRLLMTGVRNGTECSIFLWTKGRDGT